MAKHLWEIHHPYYCSDENYFAASGEAYTEYRGWPTFLEEEGDSDSDYNLLFRWDWDEEERALKLYYMGQRKGLFRVVHVTSMIHDDEPSVREWLEKRWLYMRVLWEGLSGVERVGDTKNNVVNDVANLQDPKLLATLDPVDVGWKATLAVAQILATAARIPDMRPAPNQTAEAIRLRNDVAEAIAAEVRAAVVQACKVDVAP